MQMNRMMRANYEVPIQTPYKIRVMQGIMTTYKSSSTNYYCKLAKPLRSGKNFYQVLSLKSNNVSVQEIKKAYRSMVLQYHPDVCLHNSSIEYFTKRFIEVQEAYEILSDPVSRRMYDFELGLINSMHQFQKIHREEKISKFSRENWEKQLLELKRQSYIRMKKKNNV